MACAYAGGFVLLAVWTWTGRWGWALAGVLLELVFLLALVVVHRRNGPGRGPVRSPRRRLADPLVVLVALVVFFALDAGAGLLVLGLGLGVTALLQVVRNPDRLRRVPPAGDRDDG